MAIGKDRFLKYSQAKYKMCRAEGIVRYSQSERACPALILSYESLAVIKDMANQLLIFKSCLNQFLIFEKWLKMNSYLRHGKNQFLIFEVSKNGLLVFERRLKINNSLNQCPLHGTLQLLYY